MMDGFPWKPWTKTDGILTTLISLWYDAIQNNEKYVHGSILVSIGFHSTIVYTFLDKLIRAGFVESKQKTVRPLKYYITPTPSGITSFLKFYREQLEELRSKQQFHKIGSTDISRLEKNCELLEKIQTYLFGNPR